MAPKAFVSVFFLLFSVSAFHMRSARGQEKDWCVANPSTGDAALQENINYSCNNLPDCSVIQPGGACYVPNTLINHASVVMNLYYQSRGRKSWNCDFRKSGLRSIDNPSYGNCSYQ